MGQDMESKACEGQGITVTEERLLAAHQMLGPRLHTLACRILGRHSRMWALQNAILKAWLKRDTLHNEASVAGCYCAL